MLNILLAADGHPGLFIDQLLHLCTDGAYIVAYLLSVDEKIDPAVVTCGHLCCFGLSYRGVIERERTEFTEN